MDFSGLLIEEDNNYISEPPFLTFSIVGLCVLFSIFNWIFNQNNYTFGLVPNEAFRYLGLTFFTSFFIHGSILHLLGNMYFLVLLGRSIEYEIGREKALFLLILASLFGDMVDIIVRYESYIPSIGASGGIAGYLTYYCLKFRNNKLKIPLPSISIGESRYWKIKAVYFALIWVIIELIGITSNTNINHTVHLAGGFIGVLAYYYLEEYS